MHVHRLGDVTGWLPADLVVSINASPAASAVMNQDALIGERLGPGGVHIGELFTALGHGGWSAAQMANFMQMLLTYGAPEGRTVNGQITTDWAGQFGKFASADTIAHNLALYQENPARPITDYHGDAGSGGWAQSHTGLFDFIAPGTSLMSRATDKIWNSRIGDWVRAITPNALESQVHTGLNLAVSGFAPLTIPGGSGLVADYKQQGNRALVNAAEHGVAFGIGAAASAAGGAGGAAGGPTGGITNALTNAAIKAGAPLAVAALTKKPGSSAAPGTVIPATAADDTQAGSFGKALLIGLPLIAVLGLMMGTKRSSTREKRT